LATRFSIAYITQDGYDPAMESSGLIECAYPWCKNLIPYRVVKRFQDHDETGHSDLFSPVYEVEPEYVICPECGDQCRLKRQADGGVVIVISP
jgi:hypothetical protein